jgi:hypothetical protein
VTIRQPLERTVSDIHQRCNVHTNLLSNTTLDRCQRCDYSNATDRQHFYDKITNSTNTIYEGIQEMIWNNNHVSTTTTTTSSGNSNNKLDIPLLLLDNTDIDAFFHAVEDVATQQMQRGGYMPQQQKQQQQDL